MPLSIHLFPRFILTIPIHLTTSSFPPSMFQVPFKDLASMGMTSITTGVGIGIGSRRVKGTEATRGVIKSEERSAAGAAWALLP